MDIKSCSTHEQSADIMTKGFTNADNWDRATALIGMRSEDDNKHLYGVNVIPPPTKVPKLLKPNQIVRMFGMWLVQNDEMIHVDESS